MFAESLNVCALLYRNTQTRLYLTLSAFKFLVAFEDGIVCIDFSIGIIGMFTCIETNLI